MFFICPSVKYLKMLQCLWNFHIFYTSDICEYTAEEINDLWQKQTAHLISKPKYEAVRENWSVWKQVTGRYFLLQVYFIGDEVIRCAGIGHRGSGNGLEIVRMYNWCPAPKSKVGRSVVIIGL